MYTCLIPHRKMPGLVLLLNCLLNRLLNQNPLH
jgi:hypothetical protein